MRVPEAEEDVELARRPSLEDVGEEVVGRAAGPRAVQLEHLGDGVDGSHAIRVPEVQDLGSRRAANGRNRACAIVHKSESKARRPA